MNGRKPAYLAHDVRYTQPTAESSLGVEVAIGTTAATAVNITSTML